MRLATTDAHRCTHRRESGHRCALTVAHAGRHFYRESKVFLLPDKRVVVGTIRYGLNFGKPLTRAHGPVQRVYSETDGLPLYRPPFAPANEAETWLWHNSIIEYEIYGEGIGAGVIEKGFYPLFMVDVLVPGEFCGNCGKGPGEFHHRLKDDYLCIHCRLAEGLVD